MCGIFGILSVEPTNRKDLNVLIKHARARGKDSSGLGFITNSSFNIFKLDDDIVKLSKFKDVITNLKNSYFTFGHSRLVTNGMHDNQPVVKNDVVVIHNGIIIEPDKIWKHTNLYREFEIDTEIINALTIDHLKLNLDLNTLPKKIFELCPGTISTLIVMSSVKKGLLLSNNGSLYYGIKNGDLYFSSEFYPLEETSCINIKQIKNGYYLFDLPIKAGLIRPTVIDYKTHQASNLIPKFSVNEQEESLLQFYEPSLIRCKKCILPETFPYIKFNSQGVCNYCLNYKPKIIKKSLDELKRIIEPYRNAMPNDCILPFSGGRDSCFSLHLVVKELNLKPIAFTYDWGMVTDLARRNISRMCSILGVENIIVAANIRVKRENIRKNLTAWLKHPNLGMVSILTAGDKHFFKYADIVKRKNHIKLNIWGTNPLETTHFKSGFLGIKPSFDSSNVYRSGFSKQLDYQIKRTKQMLKSPGYFNSSLYDTLSGEYYRSIKKKEDYYHLFDYYKWEENEVNSVISKYGFEKAPDTNSTWRIGDGTAAFYNYIYYTVAGFTEHDTFRSNQIREGQLDRETALTLVKDENRPRYINIKWYLDAINMDFKTVIEIINSIPKLYQV
jgi:predicted glutamine amidotransferase